LRGAQLVDAKKMRLVCPRKADQRVNGSWNWLMRLLKTPIEPLT